MRITAKEGLIHGSLFIITFITTTLAGAEWTHSRSLYMPDYSWNDFMSGMPYSIPFLLILTAHEFGHYFVAIHNRVDTTLPYYIPIPFVQLSFGTLGALIRLKGPVNSKQKHFDIGIAGPLAGFVVALSVLLYGFTHLPPPEYIFQFHPEYAQFGLSYADTVYSAEYLNNKGGLDIVIGKNLLFLFFENFVADSSRIPNAHELIHYPFLFAGFISLVFTSINLLPIGQLDGGHVVYGLLGFKGHRVVASVAFILFILYAGMGSVSPAESRDVLLWKIPASIGFAYLCLDGLVLPRKTTLMLSLMAFSIVYFVGFFFPHVVGYSGWLLFVLIIGRFIKVPHPKSEIEAPLTTERVMLGWLALIIFVICFSPNPIDW